MPRHMQMPGMAYKIIRQDENEANVEYTWLCPYCGQVTTVQSIVYPSDYERLETGGFYDALVCEYCGKTTDVRFWRSVRRD